MGPAVNSMPQSWISTRPSPCLAMNVPGAAQSHRQPSGGVKMYWAKGRAVLPSPIWSNHKSCEFCTNVVSGSW